MMMNIASKRINTSRQMSFSFSSSSTFLLMIMLSLSILLSQQLSEAADEAAAPLRQISSPEMVHRLLSNPKTTRRRQQEQEQDHRRMADDDNGYGDGELEAEGIAEVEGALINYELKLLKCEGEESLGLNDEGNLQYGVAIVRACPKGSCSSNKQGGCTSGHADFAVPLEDFVEAYLNDQADNLQMDDNNNQGGQNLNNFAQCQAYDQEQEEENNNNNNNNAQYYVGPACTNKGKDIKLGLFADDKCQEEATDVTFEEISNGWTLPYSDGGLVSKQCLSCYDSDTGGLKDMCATFYEDAALKCEEWDLSHYYWDSITEVYRFGKDTTGCKYIEWMDKSEPFTEWSTVFLLSVMVIGSAAAGIYYTVWWKQQKSTLEKIDDDEDDESNMEDYHQHHDDNSHQSDGSDGANKNSGGGLGGFMSGIFA